MEGKIIPMATLILVAVRRKNATTCVINRTRPVTTYGNISIGSTSKLSAVKVFPIWWWARASVCLINLDRAVIKHDGPVFERTPTAFLSVKIISAFCPSAVKCSDYHVNHSHSELLLIGALIESVLPGDRSVIIFRRDLVSANSRTVLTSRLLIPLRVNEMETTSLS